VSDCVAVKTKDGRTVYITSDMTDEQAEAVLRSPGEEKEGG
jgi:hypothetical protein